MSIARAGVTCWETKWWPTAVHAWWSYICKAMRCFLFLDIHKTKSQYVSQNLAEETTKLLPPHPHHSYLAWNDLSLNRGGRIRFRYGTAGMLFLVHVLYKVHQSFLYPSASPWSLHWWLLYLFYLSWGPPFLPAITYLSTQSNNLKTNHKNRQWGYCFCFLLWSFFTVNQTPECRESLCNGSIHLQTYMWLVSNTQNTQGAFNSKEQMIWFLNE